MRRATVPGSRKCERVPRVVRLEVARMMPFYVLRLTCGHVSFARMERCVALAALFGQVTQCADCTFARDV